MNVLITGGTGFIGSYLRRMLLQEGHFLTIVSRDPADYEDETAKNQQFVSWDDDLTPAMEKADAVINLAGASIFGQRWTDEVKQKIYSSRIDCTKQLVKAIGQTDHPPSVMVSASGADYYKPAGNRVLDESAPAGDSFLSKVCVDWEAAAQPVTDYGVRLVHPRIGVVLEKDGGALQQMLLPFKLGVGGPIGSGEQYFPWIHMLDLCRGLLFPLKKEALEGAYNLNAPNPVTMDEFASELASQLHRPSLFKVPEFVLNIVLGEAANPVITSKRIQPQKLQQHGFEFKFPFLRQALGEIL
ncbi:TIGR01777 family oxidoreductase [Fodinibius sp. Rm-B-1B1-1]|uniref:TIGR01777 family oxidoreductase n=1 Tax=Fodinibius alkaliphilus TaxID=3140241 RepID=UPI00315A9524